LNPEPLNHLSRPPSTRNALPDDIDVNVIRMVGNYLLISLFAFLGLSQFVVKSAEMEKGFVSQDLPRGCGDFFKIADRL
jgi:hypothetical protein